MEKIIAFAGAVLLSTSTAALATGMSESSGASIAIPPQADLAATDAKNEIKSAKGAAIPASATTPNAAQVNAALREEKPLDEGAHLIPASYEPGRDSEAKTGGGQAAKDGDQAAYTPFSAVEPYEVPVSASKGLDGEAMGGPLDPEEVVAENWDSYDADGEQGLTRLEFANWAASDTGKAEFGAEAIEQRASAAEGTATVRLLNATSLEFTYADADDDMRISAEEMVTYMQA